MQRPWFTPLLIVAAALGWLLAVYAPGAELDRVMSMARSLFLDGLKMVIAPLIFFSLLSGILRLRGTLDMRRLGGATFAYYLLTTGIAIVIGLAVVVFWHPWTGLPPLPAGSVPAVDDSVRLVAPGDASFGAILQGMLNRMLVNPFSALAELNILGIVTNALLIGLAALFVLPEGSPLPEIIHEVTEVVYKVAGWIVLLAPIGILGIVYSLAGSLSADVLTQLLGFAAVVLGATLLHGLVVLPTIAWLASGKKPLALLRDIGSTLLVALTTSSSAATLPVSLQTAEVRLGVRRSTASFVLPLGATINMDGTALFEGIAAVFLAYLFGIELGAAGLVAVFFVAMVASVGAPGVPSGSMAGMQMVLLAVGIPLEAIGLLLLIERPLDTFRTAVNVQGDLIACVVAERAAFGRAAHG